MINRIIYLVLLLGLTSCGGGGSTPASPVTPTPVVPPVPERIDFSSTGNLGFFDPSITSEPNSNRLWMSYSAVDSSSYYDAALYWGVSIRLAFSDDNGVSWQDAGIVVGPNSEDIVGPMNENNPTGNIPAGSQGIWQSEMSSIVYDISAPINERWKLIWHQYLNADLVSYFVDHGWLSIKMAASPLELATAPTIKLFGAAGLQDDGKNIASPVFSPVGGAPAIQLNTALTKTLGADLNELNFCIFVEPGFHATNNALYLSMYCADASTVPQTGEVTPYIVYFRCNSPCSVDKAPSWEYVGRLLSPTDAQNETGDHFYQAPSIEEKNGRTYLTVTPVDNTAKNDRYNGCRVYEFTDVNSNQLRRDNGKLVEIARIDGDANSHHGACEAYSGIGGGILLSQFGVAGTADAFKVYKSQVKLP